MNAGQGGFVPPDGGQWPNEGPPAGGGTPYGGQPYDAPGAYGPQPYSQGGYGGTQPQGGLYQGPYGTGIPPFDPGGEPPKKGHTGLIIGLALVAVIVVLGGLAAVIGSSSGDDKPAGASARSATPSAADAGVPHTIEAPKTVGGYRRLTGSVADRLAKTMRKSMSEEDNGKYAALYATAKIAIYAKKSDPTHTLIFIGLSSSDNPAVAKELKSRSPSEEVDSAFIGVGIGDAKDSPPGPLGGVLRCGTGSMAGTSGVTACAWADSSTMGVVLVPDSRNARALADTTHKLRNAAEH